MKLIILCGLPRSGKSTYAQAQNLPIVNPDSIRLAIHGQPFFGPAEPLVWATAHIMVEALRLAGCEEVILDATNTCEDRREEWTSKYEHELIVFDTSPDVCKARALAQGQDYLIEVIDRMVMSWDLEIPQAWIDETIEAAENG